MRLPMSQRGLTVYACGCLCYRDTRSGRDRARVHPAHWVGCPAWVEPAPECIPLAALVEPLSPDFEEMLF